MRKQGWPAGLQERHGYFSWRNPVDKREYGIGRNKAQAFAQAVEANNHILGQATQTRLVDRISGGGDHTVAAWLLKFQIELDKRKLAENTKRSNKSKAKLLASSLGPESAMKRITALEISSMLDGLIEAGKHRWAQSMRSFASDVFRGAEAAGWIDKNPVTVTARVRVEVRRARLSFEQFMQMYNATKHKWLRNAMALALVTGQARDNIASAAFSEIRDEGWWLERTKTGKLLMIPLVIRLDRFGMSLDDVVRQCRRTGIISKFLVHQTRARGNSPVGRRIFIDTLSKGFAAEVEALGVNWGDKTPPTFHEIRSLAERLYREQGNVDTQELLGHEDARTTQMYHDVRGSEYVRVKIG